MAKSRTPVTSSSSRTTLPSPSTNGHGKPTLNGRANPFIGLGGDPIAMNKLGKIVENASVLSRIESMNNSGDPRRSVEDECGYPLPNASISIDLYRHLYDRCDIANRAVQLMPKECWKQPPTVYESEDSEDVTQFEADWDELGASLSLGRSWYASEEGSKVFEYLSRIDTLSRIGSYGILLIGVDDGKNLQEPIEGLVSMNWTEKPVKKPKLDVRTGQMKEQVIGVERSGLKKEPVAPDSPVTPGQVKSMKEPSVQNCWSHFDRKTKQHVYYEKRTTTLNEEELMIVNQWQAEAHHVDATKKRVLEFLKLNQTDKAAELVENSGIAGIHLGLTPKQRKQIGQGLVFNFSKAVQNSNPEGHNQYTGGAGTHETKVNGNPLNPSESKGRLKGYSDSLSYQKDHPERLEDFNVGDAIQHGLMGGLHPDQIKSDLTSLGVEEERIEKLVGRRISQYGMTFNAQQPLQPKNTFPPERQPPGRPGNNPQMMERSAPPGQQPMRGQPTGPEPRGSIAAKTNGLPTGSTQPQGSDRQYGTSDSAMSSGFGMAAARYENTQGADGTALGQANLVYGGRMSGSEQQYYGVQLGPSEYPEMEGATETKEKRRITFIRPYDESLVQIVRYEWNINNPRFGMPVMYRVTLNDPRDVHSGIGLPLATVFVHWSRVIHLADVFSNAGSSDIFAAPIQRPILNRLLDCYKLPAAAAEGYWQSGTPTKVFETHPQLGGDVLINVADMQDQVENVLNSLQKWLLGKGGSWKLLSPSMIDPSPFMQSLIELICIQLGCPVRIFKGAERGELASSQDDGNWNSRVMGRQNGYLTPRLICPFIDRMIMLGVLSEPQAYYVEWPNLESLNEQVKATIFSTLVAALAQYVQGGLESIIPPRELLTKFTMGMFSEEEVDAILEAAAAHQEEMMEEQAAQQQMQLEQTGMIGEQIGASQEVADEHGLKAAAPEGFIDPEQQEHEREVELIKAKNPGMGGGGGSPFGGKSGGGKSGGGFPPNKEGPPSGPPKFGVPAPAIQGRSNPFTGVAGGVRNSNPEGCNQYRSCDMKVEVETDPDKTWAGKYKIGNESFGTKKSAEGHIKKVAAAEKLGAEITSDQWHEMEKDQQQVWSKVHLPGFKEMGIEGRSKTVKNFVNQLRLDKSIADSLRSDGTPKNVFDHWEESAKEWQATPHTEGGR